MSARKKITLVFGTRPEAVKLCPVALALRERPEFETRVCVTAQHRQMLDQVLEVFGIVPDADLNLMQPNQTLAGLTARAVSALDEYLARERPDVILVQGDTTTVFAAALAAYYQRVAVGHVEAGLRTWNKFSPFPEEMNRVMTTRIADWHFAPTEGARKNLLAEGVDPGRVFVTGNTVIDALQFAVARIRERRPEIPDLPAGLMDDGRPLVLVTGHRRENFGEGFESICRAIAALADRFPKTAFVYPVHLNPNVREPVFRVLRRANIHLIEPLSYLPFVALLDRCSLALTDSGGVQEEAPSLGKPVLVMRDTTERPEAVDAGVAKLVGSDADRIVDEVSKLLDDPAAYAAMAGKVNPYGDGRASGRIVTELLREEG